MKISQREARGLRQCVRELEAAENLRRGNWSQEWPGGVHIRSASLDAISVAMLKTARRLGHAVVVIEAGADTVNFFALPLAETQEPGK